MSVRVEVHGETQGDAAIRHGRAGVCSLRGRSGNMPVFKLRLHSPCLLIRNVRLCFVQVVRRVGALGAGARRNSGCQSAVREFHALRRDSAGFYCQMEYNYDWYRRTLVPLELDICVTHSVSRRAEPQRRREVVCDL